MTSDDFASRPFTVTTWQLANTLHDFWSCPLRHNEKRPRERCPRLLRLVSESASILERATSEQLVPAIPIR